MSDDATSETVKCQGCECGVPLRGGMHEEETDIPNMVYVYPCTRPTQYVEDPSRRDGEGR